MNPAIPYMVIEDCGVPIVVTADGRAWVEFEPTVVFRREDASTWRREVPVPGQRRVLGFLTAQKLESAYRQQGGGR